MPRSRYKEVVDRLAADIRDDRIKPGTRLLTHRRLAHVEGLSLATATRVYAELASMGLTSGEPGRGTFVKETALRRGQGIDQIAVASDVVDLAFNYPSVPGQADLLRRALRELAASGEVESLLRYQPHGGRPQDRDTVARHLALRGLAVPAHQVLLVDGAQHGLTVTMMALLKPGDVLAVDALTYPGLKLLAEACHLELLPVPAGGEGPDLDVLEHHCKRRPVRAIYAQPTMHNPLGWVLSTTRRRKLVALARHHGALIIEDAAYAFLAEHPPPPLAALAPDITVYVSGISKSVATGLRVGFVAAPRDQVSKLERAIRATTWNTPAVMTALACRWMDDGTVASLEAAKRADAASRQTIARELLDPLQVVSHRSSYFCWLPLSEGARADQVAVALMQERVSVSTAEPYSTAATSPHALRLALGSVERIHLARAINTVKRVVTMHMSTLPR